MFRHTQNIARANRNPATATNGMLPQLPQLIAVQILLTSHTMMASGKAILRAVRR